MSDNKWNIYSAYTYNYEIDYAEADTYYCVEQILNSLSIEYSKLYKNELSNTYSNYIPNKPKFYTTLISFTVERDNPKSLFAEYLIDNVSAVINYLSLCYDKNEVLSYIEED